MKEILSSFTKWTAVLGLLAGLFSAGYAYGRDVGSKREEALTDRIGFLGSDLEREKDEKSKLQDEISQFTTTESECEKRRALLAEKLKQFEGLEPPSSTNSTEIERLQELITDCSEERALNAVLTERLASLNQYIAKIEKENKQSTRHINTEPALAKPYFSEKLVPENGGFVDELTGVSFGLQRSSDLELGVILVTFPGKEMETIPNVGAGFTREFLFNGSKFRLTILESTLRNMRVAIHQLPNE